MEVYRRSSWLLLLLGLSLLVTTLQGVQGEVDVGGPTESECRPYIEKALKELETGDPEDGLTDTGDSKEDIPTVEITTDDSDHSDGDGDDDVEELTKVTAEDAEMDNTEAVEEEGDEDNNNDTDEDGTDDNDEENQLKNDEDESDEDDYKNSHNDDSDEDNVDEDDGDGDKTNNENDNRSSEETWVKEEIRLQHAVPETQHEDSKEDVEDTGIPDASNEAIDFDALALDAQIIRDDGESSEENPVIDNQEGDDDNTDATTEGENEEDQSQKDNEGEDSKEDAIEAMVMSHKTLMREDNVAISKEDDNEMSKETDDGVSTEDADNSKAENEDSKEGESGSKEDKDSKEEVITDGGEDSKENDVAEEDKSESASKEDMQSEEAAVVEELLKESEENLFELRPRDHIAQLLKLDEESSEGEKIGTKLSEIILRDLKKLYETAIKPLETLYKYRDLSNRHFGDAEIFSKPLILFMGPWSGGKSTIINYLVDVEYNETSLHTGAEPSPAYFNILMYGKEPEILDGTELAADYTFSGLQKFGQGLEERLRGYKFPSKLLEKVNIVEIPGILEVRKQVSRIFPFNDACQWFIDRADIIFLIYDPSKLDVGPETEAILDQLKGREHQTRIVLNKADQVKPEELMRVQGALIWNISPLMSSAQPPIMYTTSLWSKPYESWAPVRLLQAQERAFLRDLRSAVDKRIDNKIASARRFAVRVRNHAKMVDCYLTTYYNHKSVFGNRKQISDEIINHPQDFHIYEGLSTLTNISRYDLPDPDVYKDFFKLNALYDFQQLSATCTYFRGCPINRLDVAIAYDLPELVGKHKRLVEAALNEAATAPTPGS